MIAITPKRQSIDVQSKSNNNNNNNNIAFHAPDVTPPKKFIKSPTNSDVHISKNKSQSPHRKNKQLSTSNTHNNLLQFGGGMSGNNNNKLLGQQSNKDHQVPNNILKQSLKYTTGSHNNNNPHPPRSKSGYSRFPRNLSNPILNHKKQMENAGQVDNADDVTISTAHFKFKQGGEDSKWNNQTNQQLIPGMLSKFATSNKDDDNDDEEHQQYGVVNNNMGEELKKSDQDLKIIQKHLYKKKHGLASSQSTSNLQSVPTPDLKHPSNSHNNNNNSYIGKPGTIQNSSLSTQRNHSQQHLLNSSTSHNALLFHPPIGITKWRIVTRGGVGAYGSFKLNQDSKFVCERFADMPGNWYMGVCDGHGVNGHHVSQYVVTELPKILRSMIKEEVRRQIKRENKQFEQINSVGGPFKKANPNSLDYLVNQKDNYRITQLFESSFRITNQNLCSQPFDITMSGTTVCTVLIIGQILISANVGDSRAVMGRLQQNYKGHPDHNSGTDSGLNSNDNKPRKSYNWTSIALTKDHKPDDQLEYKRIVQNNG